MESKEEILIKKIKKRVMDELEYKKEVTDEQIEELIQRNLSRIGKEEYLPLKLRVDLGQQIYHSLRKLDILQQLLDNPDITEIMVNGPDAIFVEEMGSIRKLDKHFESGEKLKDIIQQIVAKCNRVVNDSSPIVDARLEDGSRVNVVLNPVAINGPILTIRRFPKYPFRMENLVDMESISKEAAEFLEFLVKAGYNIIVSGGTGSGKTTFLNALSGAIPKDERIITIEDSAELQIQGIENLVRLETKNANVENCTPITIRDLVKTSLRMRPTRIIIGEVRSAEAMDMICSAMNCGHDGSMSTVHANSAKDALLRLETMILMAANLPIAAIRHQISSGVDIIVHLGRLRDKSRRVLEIVELDACENGEIPVNVLFRFKEDRETDGRIQGRLLKIGDLKHVQKWEAAGLGKKREVTIRHIPDDPKGKM